jgi:hypothetical protein
MSDGNEPRVVETDQRGDNLKCDGEIPYQAASGAHNECDDFLNLNLPNEFRVRARAKTNSGF